MKKRKAFICIAACILLAAFFLCAMLLKEEKQVSVFAELEAEGKIEQLRFWESGDGVVYLFLPSYGEMDQLCLRTNAPGRFLLDGVKIEDGTRCAEWKLNETCLLSDMQTQEQYTVIFVRSGDMPALFIDVSSGSMEYIHEQRGNEETGTYRLYTEDGGQAHMGSVSAINGRGNASWWGSEKKPYSLELSVETDMLGMGKARKWILLANSMDRSHMKNKVVLDFAEKAGLPYSADSRWVDLYLNGEYAGLYLLCERNEIHRQRVDIPMENSFLVSLELESRLVKREYPYIRTQAAQALRIHQQNMETEQLQQMWQSVENAILSPDDIDPVTGKHLLELIDLDSWVRKYLLEEVFANVDACSISQYFYADGSGRIFAGPPWDYDGAMGHFVPQTMFGNRIQASEIKPLPWFSTLYQKDFFLERVKQLYEQEFRPLLKQLLSQELGEYAGQIQLSAAMNAIRWPGVDQEREWKEMEVYMAQRMAFLDSLWIREEPYCTVYVDLGTEINSVNYMVSPGSCLPELPEYADTETVRYHGWYIMGSEEPFDITQPIYEDMQIYLKQTSLVEETVAEVIPVWEEEIPVPRTRLMPVLLLAVMLGAAALWDLRRHG